MDDPISKFTKPGDHFLAQPCKMCGYSKLTLSMAADLTSGKSLFMRSLWHRSDARRASEAAEEAEDDRLWNGEKNFYSGDLWKIISEHGRNKN